MWPVSPNTTSMNVCLKNLIPNVSVVYLSYPNLKLVSLVFGKGSGLRDYLKPASVVYLSLPILNLFL